MSATSEADWVYCEQALIDVSRTFSKPIQLLPQPLQVALTCGYLLCRIVDTVEDHKVRLAQSLPRVMNVFLSQDAETRRSSVAWLSEMANGMRLYCRRDRPDALTTINTVSDLERYCYFVAGTVGHLITDMFVTSMGNARTAREPK